MSVNVPSISCPKCGRSVSDDSVFCPYCGCKLSEPIPVSSADTQLSPTTHTESASNVVPTADTETIVETNSATANDTEPIVNVKLPTNSAPSDDFSQFTNTDSFVITKPQKQHKKRNIIIIAAILIVIAIIGLAELNSSKEAEYYNNMLTVTQTMVTGAADAETAANLILRVWQNAIWKEDDPETDLYTQPDGYFVDDFNDALHNLFDNGDFQTDISKIEDNRTEVISLMQDLKNPPQKYQEAYSVLQTCYENYSKLTQMAINPSGSLNSFSDDFHEADTTTANSLTKMVIYFDN